MTARTDGETRNADRERKRRDRAVAKFKTEAIGLLGGDRDIALVTLKGDPALFESLDNRLGELESKYGKSLSGARVRYPVSIQETAARERVGLVLEHFQYDPEVTENHGVSRVNVRTEAKRGNELDREVSQAERDGFHVMTHNAHKDLRRNKIRLATRGKWDMKLLKAAEHSKNAA